jgi:hypothetical protein
VSGAGAVFGAIGIGRVEDPTVEPGALATRGPLQGAHINKTAITAAATMSPIRPPPLPVRRSAEPKVSRFKSLRLRSSLSISFLLKCPQMQPLQNTMVPVLRRDRMKAGSSISGRRSRRLSPVTARRPSLPRLPAMNHLQIGLAEKHFEYQKGSLVISDEPILKRGRENL